MPAAALRTLTANEAACVTDVPLRQVHRIIDTGVLGSAAARREGSRLVHCDGLVSLKLVHETTAIFTLDGRRRLFAACSIIPRRRQLTCTASRSTCARCRRRCGEDCPAWRGRARPSTSTPLCSPVLPA